MLVSEFPGFSGVCVTCSFLVVFSVVLCAGYRGGVSELRVAGVFGVGGWWVCCEVVVFGFGRRVVW